MADAVTDTYVAGSAIFGKPDFRAAGQLFVGDMPVPGKIFRNIFSGQADYEANERNFVQK